MMYDVLACFEVADLLPSSQSSPRESDRATDAHTQGDRERGGGGGGLALPQTEQR